MNVHLAVLTVELQTETAFVGQYEKERLLPYRLPSATSDTVAEGITDAMTALHENRSALGRLNLKGRADRSESLLHIEPACSIIGDII